MSMYRSYFLKNGFYAKKGNEKNPDNVEKVYIKHDLRGGIYAILQRGERRGVKVIVDGVEQFFDNFNKLDMFLNALQQKQDDFLKILRRKNISQRLRMLDI